MADSDDKPLHVDVAYAHPQQSVIIPLDVSRGTTIKQVIEQSGILETCPEIDLARNAVGVFSKVRELQSIVNDGDRVEIYRPLTVNPREARRMRAVRQNSGKT
ncbi:MAG: RnfH family protein [Gammaproteobacteria bacterium]